MIMKLKALLTRSYCMLLTYAVLSNVTLQLSCIVIVSISSHNFFDQLGHLHVDELVFLGDLKSIFFLL